MRSAILHQGHQKYKKSLKNCLKKEGQEVRRSNRGGEFDLSTLYAGMEIAQLLYAKRKRGKVCVGKSRYLCAKERNCTLILHHMQR
jgi:hypothetical protein